MKKVEKVLLILLVIALLFGAAGVAAGTVLGAHPAEIGGAILREAAERSNLDIPYLAQILPSPSPEAE